MPMNQNIFMDLEAIADEDSEEEEGQDEDDEFLAGNITQADEDEDENENNNIVSKWQQMARRLQWHSSAREYQSDKDIGYQLQNTDMLWEIGCRIGEEETIPFKVLQRACHPSTPEVLASSIVATPIPGRIYAEVTGFAQATKLARSLAELDPLRISLVPREDIPKILNFASSRHACQQWARVGGKKKKWHWYQGDTGLIEKVEGSRKKYLALISKTRFGGLLEVQVGLSLVEDDEHGRFIWNKQTFSAEGLLLVDLDDIDILPLLETLPSSAELAVFRSTSLLSMETAVQTDRMIIQTRMNIRDRVKVMVGTYLGMLGNVVEMKENEVAVYLPSQDIIEDMLQDSVQAAFDIGDQVVVVDGERKGLVGWVIGISADRIRVLNIQDNIEVDVPKMDVEFHTPTVITGLRPREDYPKWGSSVEKTPTMFTLANGSWLLGCISSKDTKGESRNRAQVVTPSTLATSAPSDLAGLTPAWDPSSHTSSHLSPAWDPSSQTPVPQDRPSRPVHWLDDPGFGNSRLKLRSTDPTVESPCVEFMGVENDQVRVRDKAAYRSLSFESVDALLPDSKGDLVTLRAGEMQGLHFKVVEIVEGRKLCISQRETNDTKRTDRRAAGEEMPNSTKCVDHQQAGEKYPNDTKCTDRQRAGESRPKEYNMYHLGNQGLAETSQAVTEPDEASPAGSQAEACASMNGDHTSLTRPEDTRATGSQAETFADEASAATNGVQAPYNWDVQPAWARGFSSLPDGKILDLHGR
ncbi:hypothetical protein BJ912DRAFT_925104 [Pholiota molesta]|nr:hypothetical protein BJ912DRAFT_925104 [Pholiota molesta]